MPGPVLERQEFLKKIINFSESLLDRENINKGEYSVTKYVVLHFFIKGIKLAKGISLLCDAGLKSNALILQRCLFEVAHYCEYILIDIKDITASENILALAAYEEIMTEEYMKKQNFFVDIDKVYLNETEKQDLMNKVPEKTKNREKNYAFILKRLRGRSQAYVNLPDEKVLAAEGIINRSFLNKVDKKFNEEANAQDLWKRYKTCLRESSKSIHGLDFASNVTIGKAGLDYDLTADYGEAILSSAATFLIRIIDVANDVFNLNSSDEIKILLEEAKRL